MKIKTKNSIIWVLAGLLALAFLGSGITKLLRIEIIQKHLKNVSLISARFAY